MAKSKLEIDNFYIDRYDMYCTRFYRKKGNISQLKDAPFLTGRSTDLGLKAGGKNE